MTSRTRKREDDFKQTKQKRQLREYEGEQMKWEGLKINKGSWKG